MPFTTRGGSAAPGVKATAFSPGAVASDPGYGKIHFTCSVGALLESICVSGLTFVPLESWLTYCQFASSAVSALAALAAGLNETAKIPTTSRDNIERKETLLDERFIGHLFLL